MKSYRYNAMAMAIAALFLPLSAAAQEKTLSEVQVRERIEAESYQPLTSSTATKIEAPLRDIPQAVDVVPQALIEDRGALSIEQALRNVPGIGLSHGDGQRDQVTIRGFTAIGDQYVDGFRDDSLYFRDMSNIERIEVLKGPGSVLYGRGSSGGMINRITKKPGPDPVNEVTLRVGSYDLKRIETDLGGATFNNAVQFRITGALEDSGSYRDQQFLEREAIAPSVAFNFTRDTRWMIQTEYLKDRRVTDFGVPAINGKPVNVDPSTYYGSADAENDDYSQSQVWSITSTLDHRFNDAWSIRNITRYYDYELDRRNTNPRQVRIVGGNPVVDLTQGKVRRDEHGIFNQTELLQEAQIGFTKHQLLYGIEVGRQDKFQRFTTRNSVTGLSLYDPELVNVSPIPDSVLPGTHNAGTLDTLGFYAQDLVTLNRHWKVLAGFRYDEFTQKLDERRAGFSDQERVDREWSPRAGVVWQPTDWQSYYLSGSRSFQPSAETFNLAQNNADLEPEETTSYEIGSKLDLLDGKASFTAALFTTTRKNIKTSNPLVPGEVVPVGEQRTNGLELSLNGQLSRNWEVSAWYAFLDAEITKSIGMGGGIPGINAPNSIPLEGKTPSLTPEHSAGLWLKHNFNETWSVGAGANYVGKMYAAPDNAVALPAYTIFDAGLFYKAKRFDVALNVYNLFDREYFVSAHGGSNILNLPGAPRTVVATVKFKL